MENMTAQDYPVPRKTLDDLERLAVFIRNKCDLAADQTIDVFQILFGDMPQYLRDLGLTMVPRSAGYMADREAYAAPAAKRIFYRPTLLAKLKFGDRLASVIFLHELAHVLLHSGRGGADKAWFSSGNEKLRFIADEESAEWQATNFALCIKAPEQKALKCRTPEELANAFLIDIDHAKARFEILRRRKPRKLPDLYFTVKAELSQQDKRNQIAANTSELSQIIQERCPECGIASLVAIGANYYCKSCCRYGSKFQDGDPVST